MTSCVGKDTMLKCHEIKKPTVENNSKRYRKHIDWIFVIYYTVNLELVSTATQGLYRNT